MDREASSRSRRPPFDFWWRRGRMSDRARTGKNIHEFKGILISKSFADSTIPAHNLTDMNRPSRGFPRIFAAASRHNLSTGDNGLDKMKKRLLKRFAFSPILCSHTKQTIRRIRPLHTASSQNCTSPPNASEGDIPRGTRCTEKTKSTPQSRNGARSLIPTIDLVTSHFPVDQQSAATL